MDVPNEIRVGPFTYQVLTVPDLRSDGGSRLYGQALYREQVIQLREDMTAERRGSALLHEIIHACLEAGGRADDVPEHVIEALGVSLYDALHRSGMLKEEP